MPLVIDLFAGPGGWSQACRTLGIAELGIELDADACATRRAAGHRTIRADVARLRTSPMAGRISGIIASPPCQGFSMAGLRRGVGDIPLVFDAVSALAAGEDLAAIPCADPRSMLVVEPLRFALEVRPDWVALEQVPTVRPVWERIAEVLDSVGYSVWTGVLNAADYGVPQTRKRAFLTASLSRKAHAPSPTHSKTGEHLPKWVSMAEALGWGMTERPYYTLIGAAGARGGTDEQVGGSGARRSLYAERERGAWIAARGLGQQTHTRWALRNNNQRNAAVRGLDEPAGTIFFGARLNTVEWVREHQAAPDGKRRLKDAIRISEAEASVLQGFPRNYPWQGNKTKRFQQIGNAVPPPLALAVLNTIAPTPT